MIFSGGLPAPSGSVNSWVVGAISAVQSCWPESSKRMLTSLPLDSILVGTETQLELPQLVIENDSPRSFQTGIGGPEGAEPFRLSGTPWYVSSAMLDGPPPHATMDPTTIAPATTVNARIPNYFTSPQASRGPPLSPLPAAGVSRTCSVRVEKKLNIGVALVGLMIVPGLLVGYFA